MKRYEYTNNMPYEYDPTHRGSHYKIGDAYKNTGEWFESVAKYHRGLEYLVNPITSYDMGSDIESMSASVKSGNCTLASIYGPSKEAILDVYFANVHSTLWIYMANIGETIIEYHMNKDEFSEFLMEWGVTDRESGTQLIKVRTKKTSGKMLKWLDKKVVE